MDEKAKKFIRAMLIRAIRTVCQVFLSTTAAAVVLSDVNWPMVLSASILGGLTSCAMSVLTGLPEVDMPVITDTGDSSK